MVVLIYKSAERGGNIVKKKKNIKNSPLPYVQHRAILKPIIVGHNKILSYNISNIVALFWDGQVGE